MCLTAPKEAARLNSNNMRNVFRETHDREVVGFLFMLGDVMRGGLWVEMQAFSCREEGLKGQNLLIQ